MIQNLLLLPHDEDFQKKCMGSWSDDDFDGLVYSKNVVERRKKMRDFFKRNRPSDSFIARLILDKQYTAVEIIASYYEFGKELQRMVINKDASMRRAYHKHHQFLRILEQKFIRRAEKSEAQSYYSRYAKVMDDNALEDCRSIKKLNMKSFAFTCSSFAKSKESKEC